MGSSDAPQGSERNFGQTAAQLSCVCVGLSVVAGGVLMQTNPKAGSVLSGVLAVLGGLSGLAALASIPWCGTRRVLLPAVCALLPVAVLVAIAVPNFVRARKALPADAPAELVLSAEEARAGGEHEVAFGSRRLVVNLPPGTPDGTRLRLQGAGSDGGDLLLVVDVAEP